MKLAAAFVGLLLLGACADRETADDPDRIIIDRDVAEHQRRVTCDAYRQTQGSWTPECEEWFG